MKKIFLLVALTLLVGGGCATQPATENTAEELNGENMEAVEAKVEIINSDEGVVVDLTEENVVSEVEVAE